MRVEPLEQKVLLTSLQPLPSESIPKNDQLPPGIVLPKSSVPVDFAGKVKGSLWSAVQPVLQRGARKYLNPARSNSAGAVQMEIKIGSNFANTVASIKRLGANIQYSNSKQGIIQAWVKPATLRLISRLPGVSSIDLPKYAVIASGSVDSAGDSLLKADTVRSRFAALGINGSGVKVGIISNGVDHAGLVGDDLPSITIDPSLSGSGDEGTAMAEIVHDVAPGAQLYFSGPTTDVEMVNAIAYLRSQGCNVIVDDVIFPGQPYFSDGIVEQAAQAAVDAGVVYLSAAGNQGTPAGFYGDSHYQGFFNNDGVGFHNFSETSAGGIDDFKELIVSANQSLTVVLQWSDPFGASGNDYDLYLMNASFNVIASSTDAQLGSQDPIEAFTWTNTTGADQLVRVLINWFSGLPNRELELFTFGTGTGAFDHATQSDVLFGQQAAPGVIAVTAINAADPGTDTIEWFASEGPSTIYTDFASQTSIQRQTLVGATIDGVQTHIGQLGYFLNPFFGTSAASPHAAGIVALMLQANPSLAPAQVTQILKDTAVDLVDYGVGYDDFSGAGRFDAEAAVFKSYIAATPDLLASSDSGISNSDNYTNDNTPTLSGNVPDGSYVSLFVNGTLSQSVQLASGQTSYSFTPGALTDGAYTFAIRVAPNSTTPTSNFSFSSVPLSVTIDTIGLSTPTAQFLYETGQGLKFTFGEDVSGTFTASDTLVDDLTHGGSVGTTAIDVNSIAIFGFAVPGGVLADGNYRVTVQANAVTDRAGNGMSQAVSLDFFALAGDANHNRTVDVDDLYILATHWLMTGQTFSTGDFNYDGVVDGKDLGLLSVNWQKTLAAPAPAILPPVPTAVAAADTTSSRATTRRTTTTRVIDLV